MDERLSRLGARTTPCYGVFVLLLTLWFAGIFVHRYTGDAYTAARQTTERIARVPHATVLWFLPESMLSSEETVQVAGYVFWGASLLWVAHLLIPWSGWISSLAFLTVVSFELENRNSLHHTANMVCGMLFIAALWYHFYAREIRAARRARAFFRTPLYPRWVYLLSVCYVSLFYTFAGLSKLAASGPGWVNGVSFQLWAYLWADRSSIYTQAILHSRTVATVFQGTALAIETLSFLAIPSARLRPWVGLALLGFHIGIFQVFHYEFDYNAALVSVVLLPFLPVVTAFGNRIWAKKPPLAARGKRRLRRAPRRFTRKSTLGDLGFLRVLKSAWTRMRFHIREAVLLLLALASASRW